MGRDVACPNAAAAAAAAASTAKTANQLKVLVYCDRRAQGGNNEYGVLDFVKSVRMGALVKLGDQAFENQSLLLSAAAVACSFECPR
jgi:hypothetical protein